MLIIIIGKGVVINILYVKVVRFMETLVRDRKYGVAPVGGYESMGDRAYNRHQKIFNLMGSLTFSSL